jgi:hypothetical protein
MSNSTVSQKRRITDSTGVSAYLDGSVTVEALEHWRMKGLGPAYVQVSKRTVLYDLDDVDLWLDERKRTKTDGSGKRPRGGSTDVTPTPPVTVHRGRGRPRIHPLPDPKAPKRPRGRPPKKTQALNTENATAA